MRHYTQLTETQQSQIDAFRKESVSQTAIVLNIRVDPSTISRELRRSRGQRVYRPAQAQCKAVEPHRKKSKVIRLGAEQMSYIDERIKEGWSPEQISNTMTNAGISRVSHETIYRYLEQDCKQGGVLYTQLHHKSRKYRKRYGSIECRGQIKNCVSIDERPEIVDKRLRIGDFEIDTVIGKNHKQALVTIMDRYSKLTLIKKVTHKRTEMVRSATVELLSPIARWVHTMRITAKSFLNTRRSPKPWMPMSISPILTPHGNGVPMKTCPTVATNTPGAPMG